MAEAWEIQLIFFPFQIFRPNSFSGLTHLGTLWDLTRFLCHHLLPAALSYAQSHIMTSIALGSGWIGSYPQGGPKDTTFSDKSQ